MNKLTYTLQQPNEVGTITVTIYNEESEVSEIQKCLTICDLIHSFFFLLLIFLFVYLWRGREKEKDRNITVWLPLVHPLLGTWPKTQACALTLSLIHI